jgi:hypothetical protein
MSEVKVIRQKNGNLLITATVKDGCEFVLTLNKRSCESDGNPINVEIEVEKKKAVDNVNQRSRNNRRKQNQMKKRNSQSKSSHWEDEDWALTHGDCKRDPKVTPEELDDELDDIADHIASDLPFDTPIPRNRKVDRKVIAIVNQYLRDSSTNSF